MKTILTAWVLMDVAGQYFLTMDERFSKRLAHARMFETFRDAKAVISAAHRRGAFLIAHKISREDSA